MPLTRTERAYIAGIVDGEGCIILSRSQARASDAYVYPQVKIANTDRALIHWLREKVGVGGVNYKSRLHVGCKDVYHWGLASNQAYEFLLSIRPFLRVKAHQADVVFALWEENKAAVQLSGRAAFGHGNPVPQWLRKFRSACWFYMKDVNRRGPKGPRFGKQVLTLLEGVD